MCLRCAINFFTLATLLAFAQLCDAVRASNPAPVVDPKVIAKLEVGLKEKNFEKKTQTLAEAARLLKDSPGQEAAFALLVESLFDISGWGGIARRDAYQAEELIVRIGVHATPVLEQKLGAPDDRSRRVAVALLTRIGPRNAALANRLKPMLQDQDHFVRKECVGSLGKFGREAREVLPELAQVATADSDLTGRVLACVAIIKIDGATPERVHALTRFLDPRNALYETPPRKEQDAIDAANTTAALIGELGAQVKSAAPDLLVALSGTNTQLRINAASALGKIEASSPEVIAALINALTTDPHEYTRQSAAVSLGKFGAKAKSAIPALIKALDHTNDNIRHASVRSLGDLGASAKPAIPRLTELSRSDARPYLQKAAAEATYKIEKASEKQP